MEYYILKALRAVNRFLVSVATAEEFGICARLVVLWRFFRVTPKTKKLELCILDFYATLRNFFLSVAGYRRRRCRGCRCCCRCCCFL